MLKSTWLIFLAPVGVSAATARLVQMLTGPPILTPAVGGAFFIGQILFLAIGLTFLITGVIQKVKE